MGAANAWVDKLEAAGSTDISAALEAALDFRTDKASARTFQVVFLTDGLPTVGLTETPEILGILDRRDSRGIRIYTFGVGDDVDAHLLDLLAEKTSACSTYVRPNENLEAKVAAFSQEDRAPGAHRPEAGDQGRAASRRDVSASASRPVSGRAASGRRPLRRPRARHAHAHGVMPETKASRNRSAAEFPEMAAEHDFVAPIWARRKVGYLLDQVRLHGESAEVKNELVKLARDYSIATPYTSLLVVPECRPHATAVARRARAQRQRRMATPMPPMFGGLGGISGMAGDASKRYGNDGWHGWHGRRRRWDGWHGRRHGRHGMAGGRRLRGDGRAAVMGWARLPSGG